MLIKTEGLWLKVMNVMDQIETILRMSWENARKEKDPLKNQKILESIVSMLPYETNIYDTAVGLIEREGEGTKYDPNAKLFWPGE